MANPQLTHVRPLPFRNSTSGFLPIFDEPQRAEASDNGQLLQLSNLLQTSLELEDVLNQFSDEIKPIVEHDYLAYSNAEQGVSFSVGKTARSRLSYELSLKDKLLGKLVIARRRKFTAKETQEVEQLIGALLYPLRNALLYRAAVQAAQKDALTGAGNRAALNEALSREIEVAQRHNRNLGMIIFDIDHFKKINDTYGHATGDCLLKALTHAAEDTIRLSDQLFRYGGEEFVVLLPETGLIGVKNLAERIRRNVEALDCACEGHHIKMTASFGVATLNDDEDEDAFFARTDKALYKAKHGGRNCTKVAD